VEQALLRPESGSRNPGRPDAQEWQGFKKLSAIHG